MLKRPVVINSPPPYQTKTSSSNFPIKITSYETDKLLLSQHVYTTTRAQRTNAHACIIMFLTFSFKKLENIKKKYHSVNNLMIIYFFIFDFLKNKLQSLFFILFFICSKISFMCACVEECSLIDLFTTT